MSGWFVLVVLLAAINPPRLRPHLDVRERPGETLTAAVVVLLIGALLIAFATAILDAFAITDETWHIGVGAVGALVGARMLIAPKLDGIETPDGWAATAAPFVFPLLLTPQLVVLTILLGATESKAAAVGWLAAALALTVGAATVPHRRPGLWSAAARFLGAVLVILSIALIVAGIRDV
jgi:small neutral amino acid transporter SnatA (MarC family)